MNEMTTTIDYATKITSDRPRTSSITGRDVEEETESNRGRIIQSPAVRRLQQKTQVFPLEINAAVRTRLTHSLEVQQTGRFLAREIFKKIGGEDQVLYKLDGLKVAFINIVEMSCLMHDIGNPPFGHFGEIAINGWVTNKGYRYLDKSMSDVVHKGENDELYTKIKRDIGSFDGNAQAIRLVHTLQNLNLTYSQTAALLKYTRCATEEKPPKNNNLSYLRKKPGFYYAEEDFVARLRGSVGLGEYNRFPLAYVMEAADDISYCIADLEDAVAKGLLTLKKLKQILLMTWKSIHGGDESFFEQLVVECYKKARKHSILQENNFIVNFRSKLVTKLTDHASRRYVDNHESIFNGSFNEALLEGNDEYHEIIKTLKAVAFKYIFSHPEVETLELRGHAIITGLFNIYGILLQFDESAFSKIIDGTSEQMCAKRLFNRLPKKSIFAYEQSIKNLLKSDIYSYRLLEWYYRARLLIDFVSGMTDEFAQHEYQELSAIN